MDTLREWVTWQLVIIFTVLLSIKKRSSTPGPVIRIICQLPRIEYRSIVLVWLPVLCALKGPSGTPTDDVRLLPVASTTLHEGLNLSWGKLLTSTCSVTVRHLLWLMITSYSTTPNAQELGRNLTPSSHFVTQRGAAGTSYCKYNSCCLQFQLGTIRTMMLLLPLHCIIKTMAHSTALDTIYFKPMNSFTYLAFIYSLE